MKKISLTGIKPTGTPHLGNYLGAIRPALELSKTYDTVYFIADYHALTTVQNGAEMRANIYKIAATWLALGLNPEEGLFYKQSDIPEIFELSWALSCFTPKGFMNRAHAYKDKVAKNEAAGEDPDANVNMGLYCSTSPSSSTSISAKTSSRFRNRCSRKRRVSSPVSMAAR